MLPVNYPKCLASKKKKKKSFDFSPPVVFHCSLFHFRCSRCLVLYVSLLILLLLLLLLLLICICLYRSIIIPKGGRDVWCQPPVWNFRAVIWFPFPISSLVFFCLVLLLPCNFSANGPFSWLFFFSFFFFLFFSPENSNIFRYRLGFLYGSSWAARRW